MNRTVMSGTPVIGEGNLIDNKVFINVLARAGIQCKSIYPNGPFVWLARWFHIRMTMDTKKTMKYLLAGEAMRSSFRVLPLKLELKRSITTMYEGNPNLFCFVTSQIDMAEESAGHIGKVPTIHMNSDVSGKFNRNSRLSENQRRIVYLVWNQEALDLYKNVLKLEDVHLVVPVDPIDALGNQHRYNIASQEDFIDPNLCFIKLSGSGGDPNLIGAAICSLFHKSNARSIVFPGIKKVQSRLIKMLRDDMRVNTYLDTSIYYHQLRNSTSHEPILLTYPSEQVKHVAILTQNNIFPKVAWLPPRGMHELTNLVWAIKKGFSGTVCLPESYHKQLSLLLIDSGIRESEFEFVVPENLSLEHFRPSPKWPGETGAVLCEDIIKKIADGC